MARKGGEGAALHLLRQLPHVQVELAVDVDRLRRLRTGGPRDQEVVRQLLLPVQARLIRHTENVCQVVFVT